MLLLLPRLLVAAGGVLLQLEAALERLDQLGALVDDGGEAGRVAQEVLVQALLLHCKCIKYKFLFILIKDIFLIYV